jgi:hypothetical protein
MGNVSINHAKRQLCQHRRVSNLRENISIATLVKCAVKPSVIWEISVD